MGAVADLAAAVTRTGELTVAPGAGEQTVTPTFTAEHAPGLPWVTVSVMGEDLSTAPLESQACTTAKCVPGFTARLTSRLAADTKYADTLSM